MFSYLVLLFTVIPALELAFLIRIGAQIGVTNTLFLIILTGVTGASIARRQGFAVIHKIQNDLASGAMPTEEMLNGLMIFAGGILLLTPGFITDTLGFLFLIPLTREIIKIWGRKKFKQMIQDGSVVTFSTSSRKKSHRDYEDADFKDS